MRLIALTLVAIYGVCPALAEDDAPRRVLDQWTGIVFYCAPDFGQPWTQDACRDITEGVIRQGRAAGTRVAVLDLGGGPQWMEKSAEAGFDGGNALSLLFQFKGSEPPGGNTALDLSMHAPVDPKPGVNPDRWVLVFTQTTTVPPGAHAEVAVEAAATVFSGVLEDLSKPAR